MNFHEIDLTQQDIRRQHKMVIVSISRFFLCKGECTMLHKFARLFAFSCVSLVAVAGLAQLTYGDDFRCGE